MEPEVMIASSCVEIVLPEFMDVTGGSGDKYDYEYCGYSESHVLTR